MTAKPIETVPLRYGLARRGAMTTDDEIPACNRCSCGQKIVIVNGKPRHLDEWLAQRPSDGDE